MTFFEPIPDRLRDDQLRALRSTAMRARAAYGPKDSVRDALSADVTEPFLEALDRLLRELARELNRAGDGEPPHAAAVAGGSPSSSGLNASSRNGEGTSGSYRRVRVRRARVHAT